MILPVMNHNGISFTFTLNYIVFVEEIIGRHRHLVSRVQLVRELIIADVGYPDVEDNNFRRFLPINAVM